MKQDDSSRKRPRAFDMDDSSATFTEQPKNETADDSTDNVDEGNEEQTIAVPTSVISGPRLGWGATLAATLFALASLAAGLWFTRFVSVALRDEGWLGWLAWGLAAIAAVAGLVLILREIIGFFRLQRLTKLRKDAEAALAHSDSELELSVIERLKASARRDKTQTWDLERFRESERHMREAGSLLGLADRVLLHRADKDARKIVYKSSRRVAIVTAVVPVAFVVVLFVLFENLAMIRRLAGVYGGRPGFFGGVRLFWWIIGHIAATGMIALTDDLWGQFFGQDVARRVSRRLGEGAFNGALTARLGVAALSVCRPLPHIETKAPRVRDILKELFPELKPTTLMRAPWRKDAAAD